MPRIVFIIIVLILVGLVVWGAIALFKGGGFGMGGNKAGTSFTVEGMTVEVLREGKGKEAQNSDMVTVNYVGTLTNGTKFDSSYDRKRALTFVVGEGKVIKGWDLGLVGMRVDEKRRLTIPAELAYGATGFPAAGIPENATLVFEVELLRIVGK